jgi:ribonuclease HI
MFKAFLRMSFYAVAKGRQTGIFRTWGECENQVKGFSGAVYKKFKNSNEAQQFIDVKAGCSSTAIKRNFASLGSTSVDPVSKKQKNDDMTEEEMVEFILNCDFDEEKGTISPSTSKSKQKESFKPDRIRMTKPDKTVLKTYGGHQFNEDSDGFVHVYTDGSCENNGKKHAIAGLGVYFGDNHPLNASEPVKGRATNNIGEIQAAIKAIQDAQKHDIKRLNIFTDSQFLINSVCKWMTAWKAKGWKLTTGKPVVNQVDFKKLDQLIESGNILIKWSYIAAHRGHAGNEEADRLAKEGAQKNRKFNY